jgi:hypothetical protein
MRLKTCRKSTALQLRAAMKLRAFADIQDFYLDIKEVRYSRWRVMISDAVAVFHDITDIRPCSWAYSFKAVEGSCAEEKDCRNGE